MTTILSGLAALSEQKPLPAKELLTVALEPPTINQLRGLLYEICHENWIPKDAVFKYIASKYLLDWDVFQRVLDKTIKRGEMAEEIFHDPKGHIKWVAR